MTYGAKCAALLLALDLSPETLVSALMRELDITAEEASAALEEAERVARASRQQSTEQA